MTCLRVSLLIGCHLIEILPWKVQAAGTPAKSSHFFLETKADVSWPPWISEKSAGLSEVSHLPDLFTHCLPVPSTLPFSGFGRKPGVGWVRAENQDGLIGHYYFILRVGGRVEITLGNTQALC